MRASNAAVIEGQDATTTHYAVLIGINAYPTNPLRSCVRDVQKIKECLESKIPSVNIQTLTASNDDDPCRHGKSWPTCNNVTSALTMVTSQAQPGDFVYIHYSGHGTRRNPVYDLSNKSTGDLALVLLDEVATESSREGSLSKPRLRERQLTGPQLAGLLKTMVEKTLVVTLVLDCCFSGSVYRDGDPNVRYLPSNCIGALTHDLILEDNLPDGNTRSTSHDASMRDASMRDNWLLDPDRYTILAACGPHEKAKGGSEERENGQYYGALSYFLSTALSDHGLGRRHKDIHRHLCAKFWESCQAQHPVLYGDGNQAFFGRAEPYRTARSTSIVQRDGSHQLLLGLAHGLRVGDRFALSPLGSASDRDAEDGFIAKVSHISPLTSELELLGTPRGLQTGWIAEPLTCSYLADFPIRLTTEVSHQEEWRAALNKRSLCICSHNEPKPTFQVVLCDNSYEILDECDQKMINIPAMPFDQTDINRVCNILEHLARFQLAKDIANKSPTAAFRDSLNILVRANGKIFHPGEQINVRHGSIIELAVENLGKTALYIYVYNLGPFWQIKGIFHASYEVIPAHNNGLQFVGKSSKKIKMTVPSTMSGYTSCEDIIKVFVTSQPSSFDSLELPSLDELDKANVGDRFSRPSIHESEDWMALNFSVIVANKST